MHTRCFRYPYHSRQSRNLKILRQGRLADRPGVLLLHLRHLPFRVEDAQAGYGSLPRMQACAHQVDLTLDEAGLILRQGRGPDERRGAPGVGLPVRAHRPRVPLR